MADTTPSVDVDEVLETVLKQEFCEMGTESISPTTPTRSVVSDHPRIQLDDLLSVEPQQLERAEESPSSAAGALVGQLVGINDDGVALVDFAENESGEPLAARTTVKVTEEHLGRNVVLVFDGGSFGKPMILGILEPQQSRTGVSEDTKADSHVCSGIDALLDGERIVFSAEREIVLQCGKASITLTRAGKILIRGAYVLSRSSGANRIKGGSVQIN